MSNELKNYTLSEAEIKKGNLTLCLFYAAHFQGELAVAKSDFKKGHEPFNNLKNWDALMECFVFLNKVHDKKRHGYMSVQIGKDYVWVDNPYERVFFSGNEIGHEAEPIQQKLFRGLVKGVEWLNKEGIKYGYGI